MAYRIVALASRDWNDENMTRLALAGLLQARGGKTFTVLHGMTPGDAYIDSAASKLKLAAKPVKVVTTRHDRRQTARVPCKCHGNTRNCPMAMPRRNQKMIDKADPRFIVVFTNTPDLVKESNRDGIYDMLCRGVKHDIPAYVISPWATPF